MTERGAWPVAGVVLAAAAVFALLLAGAEIVMEPKPAPDSDASSPQLPSLYGPYIAANFSLIRETQHWKIHRRSQPSDPQATLSGANPS